MSYTPALGDIVLKQFRQLTGCFSCNGISPGSEFCQLASIFIKHQIAVHHGRKTHGFEFLKGDSICLSDFFFEICIAGLKSGPDKIKTVGPDAVFELIFPAKTALGNGMMLFINKNCLDSCGAKLNTEYGSSLFYALSRFCHILCHFFPPSA